MDKKAFIVSLHEIKQCFVFAEPFSGSYRKEVTLSNGSTRTVTLTPTMHRGEALIELNDSGGITYMGLNSTTTNGTLMVQVWQIPDDIRKKWEEDGTLKPD